ncbi:hypothetical protein BDF14DRAFT_1884887 [Spinellus fusiger]|nr:hypothetical protein BDF14DRAFT_1884887 [Spinellus fusiger]
MTRNTYCILSASIEITPTIPRISSALWLDFWKIPISHVSRNIWYRTLQFKLLYASPRQSNVLSHIFSLKLPPDPPDFKSSQIIGSVLGELWRAY